MLLGGELQIDDAKNSNFEIFESAPPHMKSWSMPLNLYERFHRYNLSSSHQV